MKFLALFALANSPIGVDERASFVRRPQAKEVNSTGVILWSLDKIRASTENIRHSPVFCQQTSSSSLTNRKIVPVSKYIQYTVPR